MPFHVGRKKTGGKKPGTMNSVTTEFRAVLEKAGFCPATAMIDMYRIALEKFVDESKKVEANALSPMESQAAKYLKIASDNASDLASYAYPKMKALEQVKPGPLEGMTPEQKLEAMKNAVQMLELQIKDKEPHGSE